MTEVRETWLVVVVMIYHIGLVYSKSHKPKPSINLHN